MGKKTLIFASLLILLSLVVTSVALAATTKYTFNDVNIDGTIVEIEASVKDNNKNSNSSGSFL